ncbi:MAG: hypothetical protein WCI04_04785 [archaeon]
MPNLYTENEEKWKNLADIDYFTHFVKAWIPFNAWYKNAYPALKSDREAINEIKKGSNSIATKIKPFLTNDNPDSVRFRNYIGELHHKLESKHIENRGQRLTFTAIVLETNKTDKSTNNYSGMTYFIDRDSKHKTNFSVLATIKNSSSSTTFLFEQKEYNIDELLVFPNFTKLSITQRTYLVQRFKEVDPLLTTSLIQLNPVEAKLGSPPNYIQMGSHKFINDPTKIYKGVIELIYNLRNVLFHGQIVPDKDTAKVYEPAYNILKMMIQ